MWSEFDMSHSPTCERSLISGLALCGVRNDRMMDYTRSDIQTLPRSPLSGRAFSTRPQIRNLKLAQ